MSWYCSYQGNILTPVPHTLAQSASALSRKANALSSAVVACPGCTKSAQDWQAISFTPTCGVALNARQIPILPQNGNPPAPSPTSIPPLIWMIHYSLPDLPLNGENRCPSPSDVPRGGEALRPGRYNFRGVILSVPIIYY